MSNQLEKVKELIELRAQARLGGGEKAKENTLLANVLRCFLMKAVSKSWICLLSTDVLTSDKKRNLSLVTVLLLDTEQLMED